MSLSNRDRIYLHSPSAMLTLAVTVEPSPSAAEFERAIAAAVALHEPLNRRYGYDGSEELCDGAFTVLAAELEGDEDWRDVAAEQQREPLDIENGELARFVILEGEQKSQLVTMVHHLCGDGDSLVRLVHDILTALGGCALPQDYPTLPPPPPATGRLPLMSRSMLRMMDKRWAERGRGFSAHDYLGAFTQFWTLETEMPIYRMPDDVAQKVNDRCAAEGVTLANALITAFVQTEAVSGEMAVATNRRPAGYGGMGNFDLGVRVSYSPRTGEYWQYAKQVQNSLKTKFADTESENFLVKALEAMRPTLIDAVWQSAYNGFTDQMAGQARDLLGVTAPKEISLSTLVTSLSQGYGSLAVTEAWYVPPYSPGARRTVGVIVHGGAPSITMQCDANAPDDSIRLSLLDSMNHLAAQA